MKTSQPIALTIDKAIKNTDPVHLFGWHLNREKGVIEVAVNKNVKIETLFSSIISYKDVMMDLVTSPPVKIEKTAIVTEDKDFIEQGIIEIVTKSKEGIVCSSKLLICDFISLFQFQSNNIQIDKEFWINATVEVVLSNLSGRADMHFYPGIKRNFEDIKFGEHPEPISPEKDVQLGCMTWIMLKNKTASIQNARFVLQSKSSEDPHAPARIKIDNDNIEIVESMPIYLNDLPGCFSMHPTRQILHKMYSNTSMQVLQAFNNPNEPMAPFIPKFLPTQMQSTLVRMDLDFEDLLYDKKVGDLITEVNLLPNANLVLFFTGRKEKDIVE